MITLSVNGQNRAFPAPITAAQLIEALQLMGKRVALERNGEIVPRARFQDEALMDGDTVEIVVAVGGG